MNNPMRRLFQSTLEIPRLRKLVNPGKINKTLEIGCGSGYGSQLIMKHFSPRKIIATDLDSKMISIAQGKYSNKNIDFQVASTTKLPFKDNTFDAVFDFGVLHHIPEWKKAVKEITRTLKPKGLIIMEDFSIETFESPLGKLLRIILDHPYDVMYKQKELSNYIKAAGNIVVEEKTLRYFGVLKYFVVVARKK